MIVCNEYAKKVEKEFDEDEDDDFEKIENLSADLVIKTTKREALEYSYFSLGGYEAEVGHGNRVQFDFDNMEGSIVDSHKIVFTLKNLSNCFDETMRFEDFKNITNWFDFSYYQDIENGESDVYEEVEVLDFIIFSEDGEEYSLPDNVIEMINSCIKERAK